MQDTTYCFDKLADVRGTCFDTIKETLRLGETTDLWPQFIVQET